MLLSVDSLSLKLLEMGHFANQHFILSLESVLLVLYMRNGVESVIKQFSAEHWDLLLSCLDES